MCCVLFACVLLGTCLLVSRATVSTLCSRSHSVIHRVLVAHSSSDTVFPVALSDSAAADFSATVPQVVLLQSGDASLLREGPSEPTRSKTKYGRF